ncbi:hypothetical protein DFP72DRAFT_1173987 [Ephemerocybe angulata]|uniref:Uncharacterized protein n=1 Tax=Ephemerocybe angulata TaxID=980116 RepID=A0A8H6LZJ9_9AGAR|nr:hypothetical protein DFP72DRAFT_1173987 [Tulosesus angulatus]
MQQPNLGGLGGAMVRRINHLHVIVELQVQLRDTQSNLADQVDKSTTAVATEEIKEQIVQLTAQGSAVVALTSTLEAQHTAAQSTTSALEKKVEQLESLLRPSVAPAPPPVPEPTPVVEEKEVVEEDLAEEARGELSKESLSERIAEWMKNVKVKWNNVQEEWDLERERLGRAGEEWERRVASLGQGQQARRGEWVLEHWELGTGGEWGRREA